LPENVTEGAAPASSGRRALVLVLKIAVSVGLLALLLWKSDAPRLWHYVRSASIAWLATALGFYLLMILASSWRWGLLLTAQGVEVPARTLTGSFLVATFFNNFLPSNIGGDVIRIADTPSRRSHERSPPPSSCSIGASGCSASSCSPRWPRRPPPRKGCPRGQSRRGRCGHCLSAGRRWPRR